MDSTIKDFIGDTFHPDFCLLIEETFVLLDKYNYPDIDVDFINLLMQPEMLHEDRASIFVALLESKIDFVLKEHTIEILPEVSITIKKQLIEGLYNIQNLNDYSELATIIDSDENNEDKLVEILSRVSELSPDTIITSLSSYSDGLFDNLKKYIETKIETATAVEVLDEASLGIIENMKLFQEYLKDTTAIGIELLKENIKPNQPFKFYLNFIKDIFDTDDYKFIGLNLLSILMISQEGKLNPILAFKENSHLLFNDLNMVSKIDAVIMSIHNDFSHYQIAKKQIGDQS